MATFTYIPSYTSALSQEPRILEAKFGDGYEQAVTDGINFNPKMWKLSFSNISHSSAATIISFFTTNNTATTSFDWTDPDGDAGKYKCKKWDKSFDGADHVSLSCEFQQVFW